VPANIPVNKAKPIKNSQAGKFNNDRLSCFPTSSLKNGRTIKTSIVASTMPIRLINMLSTRNCAIRLVLFAPITLRTPTSFARRSERPKGLVLTEIYAKALFGSEDPIGKSVRIDSVNQVSVQAVLKDLPSNSSFKFDILLPFEYAKIIGYVDDNWSNNSLTTYVLLKKGVSLTAFNSKIRTYLF